MLFLPPLVKAATHPQKISRSSISYWSNSPLHTAHHRVFLRFTPRRKLYQRFPQRLHPFVFDSNFSYREVLHLSQGWINTVKRSVASSTQLKLRCLDPNNSPRQPVGALHAMPLPAVFNWVFIFVQPPNLIENQIFIALSPKGSKANTENPASKSKLYACYPSFMQSSWKKSCIVLRKKHCPPITEKG